MKNAFLLSLVLALPAFGQDNAELERMFDADQAAREAGNIDWDKLDPEDAARRNAVLMLLQNGAIKTAQDYYHAAMIFQHARSADEIRLAHAFATISATLESSDSANWLKAASWDRLMLNLDKPQWYGTQYVLDASGAFVLYDVLPDAVSDAERAAWSVPPLDEARARTFRRD